MTKHHQEQQKMIGGSKDARSKTSRSSKANDRSRRKVKRAERETLKLDIQAGRYERLLP